MSIRCHGNVLNDLLPSNRCPSSVESLTEPLSGNDHMRHNMLVGFILLLCILFGGQFTVAPRSQTTAEYTVFPKSCQDPSRNSGCNNRAGILLVKVLLICIGSDYGNRRSLFYTQPNLDIDTVNGRRLPPHVHTSVRSAFRRGYGLSVQ
jgi:hypothetical protein